MMYILAAASFVAQTRKTLPRQSNQYRVRKARSFNECGQKAHLNGFSTTTGTSNMLSWHELYNSKQAIAQSLAARDTEGQYREVFDLVAALSAHLAMPVDQVK